MRESIIESFAEGVGVTARVMWLTQSFENGIVEGRPRWLHATPMFGSDEKIGVWMVVLVEDEPITGPFEANAYSPHVASIPRSPLRESSGPPPSIDTTNIPRPGRNRYRKGIYTGSSNNDLYAKYLHRNQPHRDQSEREQQRQHEQPDQDQPLRDPLHFEQSPRQRSQRERSSREQNQAEETRLEQLHREHREQHRTQPRRSASREVSRTRKWAAQLAVGLRGRIGSPSDGLETIESNQDLAGVGVNRETSVSRVSNTRGGPATSNGTREVPG